MGRESRSRGDRYSISKITHWLIGEKSITKVNLLIYLSKNKQFNPETNEEHRLLKEAVAAIEVLKNRFKLWMFRVFKDEKTLITVFQQRKVLRSERKSDWLFIFLWFRFEFVVVKNESLIKLIKVIIYLWISGLQS